MGKKASLFTPLSNSVSINTLENNAISLSTNISQQVGQFHIFHKKPNENVMRHLKRICRTPCNKSDATMVEAKSRACLFLAIYEQLLMSTKSKKSTKLKNKRRCVNSNA